MVSGVPVSWSRVPALRAALDEADIALWLDADALVLSDERDPADALDAWQAFAFDSRYGPAGWLWVLRSCREARSFLEDVWRRRHHDYGRAWEQGAIHELLTEAPSLLGWPWTQAEGAAIPGVAFAHASYNCGTYAQRAAYLQRASVSASAG